MKRYITIFSLLLTVLITASNVVNAQTTTTHRKWSNRAKGAAIGGGAGAIAGGLIGHGVGGALIGGAIGAGGGYIIGDAKDRKQLRARQAYYRTHHHPRTVYQKTTTRPKEVTTVTTTKYN